MIAFIEHFVFSGQIAMTFVFGMIGCVIVFAGVRQLEKARQHVAACWYVPAKVRGFSALYVGAPDLAGRDAGVTYGYPIVEFRDPGGNRRLVKAKYVSTPAPFKIGAVMSLLYDPHSSSPPDFVSPKDLYGGCYFLIGVGAIFLALALAFPVFDWQVSGGDGE